MLIIPAILEAEIRRITVCGQPVLGEARSYKTHLNHKKDRHGGTQPLSQLHRKHKKKDHGSDPSRHKFETLFEKCLHQKGWGHSSSARVPVQPVHSPEFKPQYHQKKKSRTEDAAQW
jgi:hypothetical protein